MKVKQVMVFSTSFFFFIFFFFCSWEHSLSKAVLVVTIHILGKSIVMRSCANVVG